MATQNPSPSPSPSPAKPADATKPLTAPSGKVYDIHFNGNLTGKVRLQGDVNVREAWVKFQADHPHVSDKKGAFPTSFIGELVNKYGGEQVATTDPAGEKLEFRI